MSAPDESRPARLSSPGEVAAAIPLLMGFTPRESVVLLALQHDTGRLGLMLRLDVPRTGPADGPPTEESCAAGRWAREVVARLRLAGATGAVVVLYTEVPDDPAAGLPQVALVRAVRRELAQAQVVLVEALLVRAGRWHSYTCSAPCCPRGGEPVSGSVGRDALTLLAAEQVLAGRQVLADRSELVALLAPAPQRQQRRLGSRLAATAAVMAAENLPAAGATARTVGLLRSALAVGGRLEAEVQARLIIGLCDVPARDEVALLAAQHGAALLALLEQLCQAAVPPWSAAVCTLLGWTAYLDGQGALASIALDRALAEEPGYALAGLLSQALACQVPPGELQAALAGRDLLD